jgi:hypothetical protein
VHEGFWNTVTSFGSMANGYRDEYDNNLDGVFETVLDTPAVTTLSTNQIDPDRHQAYAAEWLLGYQHQLPGRTTLSASFVRRAYDDRPALVDVNGIFANGKFLGYQDPTKNQIYQVTNNTWNAPVYSSLELLATRETSRLQLIGSYTRQWRHLDGTWQPNDPASLLQPSAFANDKGLGDIRGSSSTPRDANSLSGTSMAGGPQWRDHAVRLGAVYSAPWGVTLATNYTWQAGPWSGPIVTKIAAADPSVGPPLVVLSNGRSASNPLATTIRFAFDTRGDGQFHPPGVHDWNVRAGKRLTLASRQHLDLAVDVFNVPNFGRDYLVLSGANQLYNTNYGKSSQKQLPRSVSISATYAF